jgi:hypothetical protein
MQQGGLIQHVKPRNPLRAERSPRDNSTFDFAVPPAQHPEKERWKHPETDWGLMAKFQSQKDVYEAIYERERNHHKDLEEIRAAKIINANKIEIELKKKHDQMEAEEKKNAKEEKYFRKLEKMIENPLHFAQKNHTLSREEKQQMHKDLDGMIHEYERQSREQTKNKTTGGGHGYGGRMATADMNPPRTRSKEIDVDYFSDPKGENILDYSSKRTLTASTKLLLAKQEKALLATKSIAELKASQIRDMRLDHPDVLKHYRAERAAKFIEKRGENAIQPPVHREVGETAFRPGGGTLDFTKIKNDKHLGHGHSKEMKRSGSQTSTSTPSKSQQMTSNPSNVSLPMATLQMELAKTQQEIDRQHLKMALHGSEAKVSKLYAGR